MRIQSRGARLGLLVTRFFVLVFTVSCTGCVTAIGYGIGSRLDDPSWRTMEPPWSEALRGLQGKRVRLGVRGEDRVYGVLDSVWVDGNHIAITSSRQLNRVGLPGQAPKSRIWCLDEIRTIEVGPRTQRNAVLGVMIGLPIDIGIVLTAIYVLYGRPNDS
jgi:hypothetical protein